MKRILFLSCTLLLVAVDVLAQPGPWKRYTIRREEFSVMLPALPAMSTKKAMFFTKKVHGAAFSLGITSGFAI